MECDILGSTEAFGMCRGRARGSSCQKADLKDGDARVCALCQSLRIQLSCEKLIRGKEIEEGGKKGPHFLLSVLSPFHRHRHASTLLVKMGA